jgi:4-hydroxy-4-methyl-2-oxoglutarate aldolase
LYVKKEDSIMAFGYRVFTQINRPPAALVARFVEIITPDPTDIMEKAGSPDLADVMQNAGVVEGAIRPIYQPMPRFAGPAVTVSVPTSSFIVSKIAMDVTEPGDVLVMAARGNTDYALLGGNICKGLKRRGLAGVIIDGAARDAEQIREVGLPLHARGLATGFNYGPKGQGEVNVPVAFGQCVIFPGDIIVADEQGIVVVPPVHAEEILRRVAELIRGHVRIQPILERGEVVNIGAIRKELEDTKCEFLDMPWTKQLALPS